MRKTIALLFLIVFCAACLKAEHRHAFYLEPDGSATWAVLEEDVRSDEEERAARYREESEYLRSARRGDGKIAVALYQVGATQVRTTIVRDATPYTVLTEAEFDSAAWMLESFLEAIGFEAEASLRFEGRRTTLSFVFRESTFGDGEIGAADGPAACLIEPVEQYRFVLTAGRFVESSGFRLEAGNAVAVMIDPDEEKDETETDSASYSLTWVAGR